MEEISSDDKKKMDELTDRITEDLLAIMAAYMRMSPEGEGRLTYCALIRSLSFVSGKALGTIKSDYRGNFEEYLSFVIGAIIESTNNTYNQLARVMASAEEFSKKSGIPLEVALKMIEKQIEEANKVKIH